MATTRAERARRNFVDEANRYDTKRRRLVRCARELAEQGNAAKISVTDVTSEMGITRGLFYYYFSGKEELNEAIAQTYVEDLLESIEQACEGLQEREEAVACIVRGIRAWLFDEEGQRRLIWHVLEEMRLEDYTRKLASEGLAELIVRQGLMVKYGKSSDEALLAHARLVATGMLGECRLQQEVPEKDICEAACASMRYRKRHAAGSLEASV